MVQKNGKLVEWEHRRDDFRHVTVANLPFSHASVLSLSAFAHSRQPLQQVSQEQWYEIYIWGLILGGKIICAIKTRSPEAR
jgi:hypothetical protein